MICANRRTAIQAKQRMENRKTYARTKNMKNKKSNHHIVQTIAVFCSAVVASITHAAPTCAGVCVVPAGGIAFQCAVDLAGGSNSAVGVGNTAHVCHDQAIAIGQYANVDPASVSRKNDSGSCYSSSNSESVCAVGITLIDPELTCPSRSGCGWQ